MEQHSLVDQALAYFSSSSLAGINGVGPPGLFINTTFRVGPNSTPISAFIDTGNNYFNALSNKICPRLGISLQGLLAGTSDSVRQAGDNATLRVLGKVPPMTPPNGFVLDGLNKLFPFEDMYVIENLHHDFNVSLTYLTKHQAKVDLENNCLTFKDEQNNYVHLPFIQPMKAAVFCAGITPVVPKSGITIRPHQEIFVDSSHPIAPGTIAPREPHFPSKDPDVHGIQEDPWEVSQVPSFPGKLRFKVRNISNISRTIYDKFKLGHVSSTVLPEAAPVQDSAVSSSSNLQMIKDKITVEPQFERDFLHKLHALLFRLSDVVSFNGEPGLTTLGETYINTGTAKGIRVPPRRMSPDVEKIVQAQIDQWLKEGVIVPVCQRGTDWNHRLLVVAKRQIEGEPKRYRVCVDLRNLNRLCSIDHSPFAPFSLRETFHMLGRAKIFSSIDLTQAFCSIPVHQRHQYKTAFDFNGSVFYFAKTPFGLASAPASLGKVLAKAFKDVPRSFCTYYMDDVIIYSRDAASHLQHVTCVLTALLAAGLKINLAKCKFFRTCLEFLGHLITTEGYRLIQSYLDPILKWPMVTSKYDVQAFLGCTNYYNSFIKFYATLAKPLYNVLQRPGGDHDTQKFDKKEAAEIRDSMDKLKRALTSAPTLSFADFGKGASDFVLDTDYSAKHHTIGAILSQCQPPGSGCERVILYSAKSLRKAKKAYTSYYGELFAVCYFIKKLAFYLQLRHFCLRCDMNSLIWLKSQAAVPTQIILRFLQVLAEFNFTVVHRPRKEHVNADSLSRRPDASPVTSDDDDDGALASITPLSTPADPLDCPFCAESVLSRDLLDHHVDTAHVSLRNLSFKEWQALQKTKLSNLEACYETDAAAASMARRPVRLATSNTFENKLLRCNDDGSITYSWRQWIAYQRLDQPLRLAMDTLNELPLTEPISKDVQAFVKDGQLVHGMLHYKFFPNNYTTGAPRLLAVVPFALQIPVLMFFHLKHGCISKAETIRIARQYVYFKNMPLAFAVMQRKCGSCCRRNKPDSPNQFQLISHRYVEAWHTVSLDHVGPMRPPQNGCSYLLTVKDLFTGWVEIFPVPSTAAQHVVDILALEICARYGVPHILLTDRHQAFAGTVLAKFCKELGIILQHSSAKNPKSNFVERTHVDLKRKANSLLRQQEAKDVTRYKCDLCGEAQPSQKKLELHLDTHDHTDIPECVVSPKEAVKRILEEEARLRPASHHNWLATIPTILWSIRTAVSSSRGASPYELMFGRRPSTSLDLLYGQHLRPANYSSSAEFLRARTRRDEVAEAFTKLNLARQLVRQRKYYVAKKKSFTKGELVYLFTPVPLHDVSAKFASFWSGPWRVDSEVSPTTYRIKPVPGQFAGSYKWLVVQIDRLKPFEPSDPVVTPPPNFTGDAHDADLNIEHDIHVPMPAPSHIKKAIAPDDAEVAPEAAADPTPPWHVPPPPAAAAPKATPTQRSNRYKWLAKPKPPAKRYINLPAPHVVTRSRTRAAAASVDAAAQPQNIASLGRAAADEPLHLNYAVDAVTISEAPFYDDLMHLRMANLDFQEVSCINANREWAPLQHSINYLGLVHVATYTPDN